MSRRHPRLHTIERAFQMTRYIIDNGQSQGKDNSSRPSLLYSSPLILLSNQFAFTSPSLRLCLLSIPCHCLLCLMRSPLRSSEQKSTADARHGHCSRPNKPGDQSASHLIAFSTATRGILEFSAYFVLFLLLLSRFLSASSLSFAPRLVSPSDNDTTRSSPWASVSDTLNKPSQGTSCS